MKIGQLIETCIYSNVSKRNDININCCFLAEGAHNIIIAIYKKVG